MPTILSAVCNPTFHNIYIVLYASECGVRLDTDYILPRFDVFAETRPLLIADMNREEALSFMDKGDPWQPESVFYSAARISRGINKQHSVVFDLVISNIL